MKTRKSTTSLHGWRQAGLTLIEVVAAIVILGVVLVGIVLAQARHTRQLALAQRQAATVRAADDLLASWWVSPAGVPYHAQGVTDSQPAFAWQTQTLSQPTLAPLGALIVRLQVHPVEPLPPQLRLAEKDLVQVDLVLPDPAWEAARQAKIAARKKNRLPGPPGAPGTPSTPRSRP